MMHEVASRSPGYHNFLPMILWDHTTIWYPDERSPFNMFCSTQCVRYVPPSCPPGMGAGIGGVGLLPDQARDRAVLAHGKLKEIDTLGRGGQAAQLEAEASLVDGERSTAQALSQGIAELYLQGS
jgi:hypothetical protein